MVIGRAPEISGQVQRTGHIQLPVYYFGAWIGHVHTHGADGIVTQVTSRDGITAGIQTDRYTLAALSARNCQQEGRNNERRIRFHG